MSTISLNPESLKTWQEENLEQLRYEYDLNPNDLVIDIGAYQGEWASEIYSSCQCQIIAIEPTEYIRTFRHGQVINKAAATHNGKITFGGMSYYTSAFEQGTHEYDCFDINGLLEGVPEVAVMKINIEGSEYDLLGHIIGAGLHKRIRNFQVQFHQIEGVPYQQWYEEIAKKLGITHKITWQYAFCWENWTLKQ